MNPKLKNIAEKIRELAKIPENENFGSVIAILMIISITLTLVRIIQECNKNKLPNGCTSQDRYNLYGEEIKKYSVGRGWFTKMRIKKILRQKMNRDQYTKYGSSLLEALLVTGSNLEEDEIVTLVENSNV